MPLIIKKINTGIHNHKKLNTTLKQLYIFLFIFFLWNLTFSYSYFENFEKVNVKDYNIKSSYTSYFEKNKSVWCEYLPFPTVKNVLINLSKYDVALYLMINETHLKDNALIDLLQTADSYSVEVRAWLTLPHNIGYWANELNVYQMYNFTIEFIEFCYQNSLNISYIIIDMEPPKEWTDKLFNYLEISDFEDAINLLLNNIDSDTFYKSAKIYQNIVDFAHSHGFKVLCVTLPIVLDDIQDGDCSLQDAFNIPVTPVMWDEISFMVYRTAAASWFGSDPGPYFVYSYALDASRYFSSAGIDIGCVGVNYTKSMMDADTNATRAAGIEKIHAYSLDGMLQMGALDVWLNFSQTAVTPPVNQDVDFIRNFIQSIDRQFIENYTLVLNKGWNLISIPVKVRNRSVEAVFAPLLDKCVSVLHYNSSDMEDNWKIFNVNKTYLNDFTLLDNTIGVWVYTREDCTLNISGYATPTTEICLKKGWNLVGYPSNTTRTVEEVMRAYQGIKVIKGFDTDNEYNLRTLIHSDVLSIGNGYWIYAEKNCNWIVDW